MGHQREQERCVSKADATIHRGFRFRLDPTPEQETLFRQFAGVCRLVFNLALEQREHHHRNFRRTTGKGISYNSQAKELTALRAAVDWIAAVSVASQQQALRDLDKAFANFFARRGGYPRPRRKGEDETFRFPAADCGELRPLNAKWSVIRLPKIGEVRVRTHRPLEGRPLSVTISASAGQWFVSIACEIEREAVPAPLPEAVGIDRGVANTLTLSTGEMMRLPDSMVRIEARKRKAQRVVSRRVRGSRRRARAQKRVARLQARQARIRRDFHHRASHAIAERFGTVILEDLNTKGMTRSAKGTIAEPGRNVRQKAGLNRVILAAGWHQFAVLLTYKVEARGGRVITVPAHHTSQTCAACGAIDPRSRESQARFRCTTCGHTDHADVNAAVEILRRGSTSSLRMEGSRHAA